MLRALLLATLFLHALAQGALFDFDKVNGVALGQKFEELKQQYPHIQVDKNKINSACYYIQVPEIKNVSWMILDGMVVRADVPMSYEILSSPVIMAFISGQLTPNQAASRYEKIQIDNHEYHEGYRVTFYNNGGDRAVVADYVNHKIENLRIGLVPAAMYIEGCA